MEWILLVQTRNVGLVTNIPTAEYLSASQVLEHLEIAEVLRDYVASNHQREQICLGKRELVFVFVVHLFVSYAHVDLCHFFSPSWYQGLAATSARGSSWTFLFTFLLLTSVGTLSVRLP